MVEDLGALFLHLHEVGEVGHAAELVEVRRGERLGLEHQRDVEVTPGQLHRALAVLVPEEDEGENCLMVLNL